MSRKLKQWMIGFFAALVMLAGVPAGSLITAYAATAKISFSDPNVTVGQEFSVNVKITSPDGNLGASDVMLSYDPASIEFVNGNNASGGAGSIRLLGTMDSGNTTQFSYTLKFKALQAGNSAISVGSYEIYDVDTQAVSVSKVGSSAVTVNAPATYSSEARLSSLKVSPGQLSPAFSSEITSYSVTVGSEISKLAVSAGAKDAKAKVLVSGDSGLQTGNNTVVCKVTAEDGKTTKSYTITVTKEAALPEETSLAEETVPEESSAAVSGNQRVEVDGTAYMIAASFDTAALPEGYTSSVTTYGGEEVMCGTGNGMLLLYLQAEDQTGSFFIYMPETDTFSPYVTIDVAAKSILVLPLDESVELPEGFASTTIQLNGNHKVQGWVWQSDEAQQYCVIYGMNENGEKNLYRYDIEERTFQRYFHDPALQSKYDDEKVEELIDQYNSLCEDYNFRFIIIIVLLVVCLILFFLIINLLLHRKDVMEEKTMLREREMKPHRAASAQKHAASGHSGAGAGREAAGSVKTEKRSHTAGRRETAAADYPVSRERRTAYDRAASAERRASAQQTAAAGIETFGTAKASSAARRTSERAEEGKKRMSSGNPEAVKRSYAEALPEEKMTSGRNNDPELEELIRRREQERAERARRARKLQEEEDDFEFIEL